jgi:hypothetical protein
VIGPQQPNLNTIKNAGLIDATKEVSLGVNEEKTKYMLLSYYRNTVQIYKTSMANKFFKNILELNIYE